MRHHHTGALFTLILAISLLLGACGSSSEDSSVNNLFEPELFGQYLYERQPDLQGPRLVDFGKLPRGEPSSERATYKNGGAATLIISGWELSEGFSMRSETGPGLDVPIELSPGQQLQVELTASGDQARRGRLILESNDPDEPRFATRLIANVEGSCLEQLVAFDSQATWQRHEGEGPICWGDDYGRHGDPQTYQHAKIPAADTAGWVPEQAAAISFDVTSTLCGANFGDPDLCACRRGGDFTYFQTFFTVSRDIEVQALTLNIEAVDDGVRTTLFNDMHPQGISPPGAFAFFPGGTTTNLSPYVAPGINRVVLTHVDDCCRERVIEGATVQLNGRSLRRCPE